MKYSHHSDGKGTGIGAGVIGNYDAPEHKNTDTDEKYSRKESVGVSDGLSARSDFDGEEHGPMYNYMRDPLTGNANERPEPYESSPGNVKSKNKTFNIC